MTPDIEIDSSTTGGNGEDRSDTKTTHAYETIKSSARNGGRWCGQRGHTGSGGHQGRGGWGVYFNCASYTSYIRNLKVEVDDFGAVFGTTAKQREATDQYNKFRENLKQYILWEFQSPEDIIVLVRDLN